MSSQKYLKITLIGDNRVGKTSLLNCYLRHFFSNSDSTEQDSESTHNFIKKTTVNGESYTLSLWTTSKVQNYDQRVSLIYPNTDCFIVCYAVNNSNSFVNASKRWIPEVKLNCPGARVILVGTKLDLKNCYGTTKVSDHTVQKLKIRAEADSFLECSSRTFEGVNQVFKEAIHSSRQRQNSLQCALV